MAECNTCGGYLSIEDKIRLSMKCDANGNVVWQGALLNPPGYSDEVIDAMIDDGYVPIANPSDLQATKSVQTNRVFAVGTKWERTLTTTGLKGRYIQVADIDMYAATRAGGTFYNSGSGWEPISIFEGLYDGGGHIIYGIYINRATPHVGLFGRMTGDIRGVKNLGIIDCNITGSHYVSALGSYLYLPNAPVLFSNIVVSGIIKTISATETYVGGIFGYILGSISNKVTIKQCCSFATILTNSIAPYRGLLIGRTGNCIIEHNYTSGHGNVNGLIGASGGSVGSNNSYYNKETSEITTEASQAVGKLTSEMLAFPSVSVYTGWQNDVNESTGNKAWRFSTKKYPRLGIFNELAVFNEPIKNVEANILADNIVIAWEKPLNGSDGYDIYLITVDGYTKLNIELITDEEFVFTPAAGVYRFYVKAVYIIDGIAQTSSNSEPVSINFTTPEEVFDDYEAIVLSDGGVIEEPLALAGEINRAFADGYFTSIVFWTNKAFGCKYDDTEVVKLYSINQSDSVPKTLLESSVYFSENKCGIIIFDKQLSKVGVTNADNLVEAGYHVGFLNDTSDEAHAYAIPNGSFRAAIRANGVLNVNQMLTAVNSKMDVRSRNIEGDLQNCGVHFYRTATVITFRENNIGGNIPREIGNLVQLTGLRINNNLIAGAIPYEISKLTSLSQLHVGNNLLSSYESGAISANQNVLIDIDMSYLGSLEHQFVKSSGNQVAIDLLASVSANNREGKLLLFGRPDRQARIDNDGLAAAKTLVDAHTWVTIPDFSPTEFDKGKLVLTFDDGRKSIYSQIFPILQSKGVSATFYLNAAHIGQTIEGYGEIVTWADVQTMAISGMDMQCHGYNHTRFTNYLTESEFEADLEANNTAFLSNNMQAPNHSAAPYGGLNDNIINWSKSHRLTMRGTGLGSYASLHGSNIDKYYITCSSLEDGDFASTSSINRHKLILDMAKSNNLVYITFGHELSPANADGFIEIIDFCQSNGIDIITMSELYDLLDP